MAYRVLFSLVPFLAVLAALLDAVLPASARQDVIDWLLGAFPGTTVTDSVDSELASTGAVTSIAGLVAFGALIWTASGMTRSLRIALAVIWERGERPAFVRAKLRDVAALGVLAALIVGAFVLSLVVQVAVQAGVDVSDALGLGGAVSVIASVAELAVTGAATFAALVLVYRLGAPVEVRVADVWRVALITAVVIDAGLAVYAFYLVNVAGLDSVYGPLGAILAFLALLYAAAAMVLFGAELIALAARSPTETAHEPRAMHHG